MIGDLRETETPIDPAQADVDVDFGETGARIAGAFKAAQEIAGEFSTLATDVRAGATRVGQALRGEVDAHPYRTVAIAAGVGYVLGGGLASRLSRFLLRAAFRTVLIPALQDPLAQAWGAFTAAADTKPVSR